LTGMDGARSKGTGDQPRVLGLIMRNTETRTAASNQRPLVRPPASPSAKQHNNNSSVPATGLHSFAPLEMRLDDTAVAAVVVVPSISSIDCE